MKFTMTWYMYLLTTLMVTNLPLYESQGTFQGQTTFQSQGAAQGVPQVTQVPCLFIFGDSLSDSGNNNHLASFAKANYLPYGIDFPGGPTGRFTNGRTTIDLVGDHLGLDGYIQPFSNKSHTEYVKGVNYASGSAGIMPETGMIAGQRICMDKQLEHHKEIVNKINTDMGNGAVTHLNKCLYSFYVGSNDWMLNFFGGGSLKYKLSPNNFGDTLITKLTQQINTAYDMGARKVIVFGLGPLGCLPPISPMGVCSPFANAILEKWNNKLKTMVENLNAQHSDAKFIWINTIQIVTNDLRGLGLKVRTFPCCAVLATTACIPLSIPCITRSQHAYWDLAHPTEAANKVLASRAFKATQPTDTFPMDISQLAALNL